MYEVRQYDSNELPAEIAAQVVSFIRLVWMPDQKGEDRFWTINDPSGEVRHFVIAERGILISYALVRQRAITHMGNAYRLLGVGGVMTYPDFRREGYGRQVVNAATDYILQSGVDVGMLFTGDDLHPFYQASGWTPLKKRGVYYGDAEQPKFMDSGIVMLFVSERAKAHRDDFEKGDLYVGRSTW